MSFACVLEDMPGLTLDDVAEVLGALWDLGGANDPEERALALRDLLATNIDAGEQRLELVERSASRCERLLDACDRIAGNRSRTFDDRTVDDRALAKSGE